MKTSRMLTLLAVFILSMVLVTAVLAAANSTRRAQSWLKKNKEVVQIADLSIPEIEIGSPGACSSRDAVNAVVSEFPKDGISDMGYRRILPLRKHLVRYSFDPTFTSGPGGAFFAGQGSGMQPLSLPPLPRDNNIVIDMDLERVWGVLSAGEPFTVSVNGTQMGAGSVDNAGFFWTTLYDSNGDRPGLHFGDEVKVYLGWDAAGNCYPARQIAGYIDLGKDFVTRAASGNTLHGCDSLCQLPEPDIILGDHHY